MTEQEIDKMVEDRLLGMMKENSVKMCQYMLSVFGQYVVKANSDEATLSQHCNIGDSRYKVEAVITITHLQSLTAPKAQNEKE